MKLSRKKLENLTEQFSSYIEWSSGTTTTTKTEPISRTRLSSEPKIELYLEDIYLWYKITILSLSFRHESSFS